MTDDKIKEIYLFAEFAKRSGQDKTPVHIFPFKMMEVNISTGESQHQDFWQNLKGGYNYFETNLKLF
jgi:murein L,D-transpeptidase YafK